MLKWSQLTLAAREWKKINMEQRDKHCWLNFVDCHVISLNPRDYQTKRKRTGYVQVSWQNIPLLEKDMLWIRRVCTLAKEEYFSGYQASSHKASDTGHSLRKYNLFSLIQDHGTAVGLTHSEKGKLEAQNDSKTLNFEGNDGDVGMATERSSPVNSGLNSKWEEDTKCIRINDSLNSMFVTHQRDEIPAVSRGRNPK